MEISPRSFGRTTGTLSPSWTDRPAHRFTVDGMRPAEACTALGRKGICAWDGDFYAVRPMEVLGLRDNGGVTRVGISLYNSEEEILRLLEELKGLVRGR